MPVRSLRSLSPSSNLSRTASDSGMTAGSVKLACVSDELLPEEIFWRDQYLWLEESGYRLRARYQPNWEPSWFTTGKSWTKCEDGVTHRAQTLNVMDAVRTSDGSFVALKKASKTKNPDEIGILDDFASGPSADEKRNHCVPLVEVLEIPGDDVWVIIVMPLLRQYDSPWFDNKGEAVECIRQLFEGLQFLHHNHIAHRNISRRSVMMDASELYPDGFHPRDINKSRNYTGPAKHLTRTEKPPKYYFACFGMAKRYADKRSRDLPAWGLDKSVPEFNCNPPRPCNPFATDIYYLGNMLKEDFSMTKKGFKFLEELVDDMTHESPDSRPTIDEVVIRFDEIRARLKGRKLNSRVAGAYDGVLIDLKEGVPHMARRAVKSISRRIPVSTNPES